MGNILLTDQETEKIQILFDDLQSALKDASLLDENTVQAESLIAPDSNGKFATRYEICDWFNGLNRAILMFRVSLLSLHRCSSEEVQRLYHKSRREVANDLVDDFMGIIAEKLNSYPEEACEDIYMRNTFPDYSPHDMAVQARKEEVAEETQEPEEVTPPASESEVEPEPEVEENPEEIKAAAESESQTEYELDLSFDFPTTEIAASSIDVQAGTNKLPFEGVLCRIDEPSESAPSKGSLLPLYITMQMAKEVVRQVNESDGLPLDVDDSLSQHANETIAGVMTRASIQGQDLIVGGHLFPWSQKKRVALISANRERLGMSMNARARGHEADVNGRKVWWIDDIELLGANILFSNAATYQKTRVIAAAEQPLGVEIAANRLLPQEEPLEMDPEAKEKFNAISNNISTLIEASRDDSRRIDTILDAIQAQGDAIRGLQQFQSEMVKERETISAQRRQEQTAEQRQKEQQDFLANITNSIQEVVAAKVSESQEQILDRINPRRQPSRILPPSNLISVAASATGSGNTSDPQDLQLANKHARLNYLKGALDMYRDSGETGSARLSLAEEFNSLCSELGVTGLR